MVPTTEDPGKNRHLAGWVALILLLLVAAALLWARGGSFYRLDAHARVDHPDYRVLSPGHSLGHFYGFVATGLVFANLAYLLRRRVPRWRLGSMRAWLNAHVATGLLSGLLALAHSALQLRNPIAAVTMVALGITLVTGIIGRFMFFFVPQQSSALLEENCLTFEAVCPGLGKDLSARLRSSPLPNIVGRVTLSKVLWRLPAWQRDARLRKRLVLSIVSQYETLHPEEFLLLRGRVAETAQLAANASRAVAYDYLLRSWRGLHRFFALLMIVLMVVHAVVAWYYGYRGVFSPSATAG